MDVALIQAIRDAGGDPADPAWIWLVRDGPHGRDFTWNASRGEPRGFVGLDLLRRFVAERTEQDPGFPADARDAATKAMRSSDLELARKGVQVLAVLGGPELAPEIAALTELNEPELAGDARACLFELRRRWPGA